MPPFVPCKRQFSPEATASPAKPTPQSGTRNGGHRATLFQDVDAPSSVQKSAADTRRLIESLDNGDDSDSLSEVDSDEFEDVPPSKRRKTVQRKQEEEENDEDEEDDEGMEWEDAFGQNQTQPAQPPTDAEIGDISISLNEDGSYVEPIISLATGKKGPSKRERQTRYRTHCLHVMSLMWHNTVRNSWLNDKELHEILLDGLPDGVKREVRRWKEVMGGLSKKELEEKKKRVAAKGKGRGGRKSDTAGKGRNWSYDAEHLEQGIPNLSRGDPLLRLLKVLAAYWRKRFIITAPCLRKLGYMPIKRLRDDIRAWEKDKSNADAHGERIETREALRKLAKAGEGSKDVGAQLFCALLRGLGLEARMVANLQPAGLSFNAKEEANLKPAKSAVKIEEADETSEIEVATPVSKAKPSDGVELSAKKTKKPASKPKEERPTRRSERGDKTQPISLDDTDSELSDPPDEEDNRIPDIQSDSDDELSLIDVTPAPRKRPSKKYDRDLSYPNYWTEVCSPVSHKYIPVDPIVLSTIASTEDLLCTFEPRGARADKAKQVIAYTLAYSSDGSAKDVTIRYLKRHQLPGKTKGIRVPVEKIPIHDKRGKIKKYENFDWFRTVMSMYDRPQKWRTVADDLEEQTDLKPFKPTKVGEAGADAPEQRESLQWYKQSAEFVLEQNLRREEALLPDATPVKTFTPPAKKGATSEPETFQVYRRADVVACKTTESWHKEGRAIRTGEQPLKSVPIRAVTLQRKRELEDALRETGTKPLQGLYSREQTEWIIPPPIGPDGHIPKNAFGNMDVYVPSMVPRGAVHLPLKGVKGVCKKLGVEFAEACVGFEFGKQRAVPVIHGVVIGLKDEKVVRQRWREEQEVLKAREDGKRTAVALGNWRKMVVGLRILERMKAEYDVSGGISEERNPFVEKARREGRSGAVVDLTGDGTDEDQEGVNEDDMAGGFFQPGHDEEEVPQRRQDHQSSRGDEVKAELHLDDDDGNTGGGFLPDENEENNASPVPGEDFSGGGGFLLDESSSHNEAEHKSANGSSLKTHALPAQRSAPMSLQAMHAPGPSASLVTEADQSDIESPPLSTSKTKKPVPKSSIKKKPIPRAKPTTKAKSPAKATPLKSAYFGGSGPRSRSAKFEDPSDEDSDDHDEQAVIAKDDDDRDDDGEDEAASEEEIVTPRRTTRRTRGRT
ncbi:Rad4-domain-containing protein [Dissoconium aciculare CBS 342.82]|uniref:Rad4-domain-containing protein n=1 Tax=Dissoconium aciculare CBS 342.82 TaxID=1314786 RepID=A0A6J3LW85_9PEZI|nr:Rad4-domain-containing protein [Dissoconium aciculare CBS 342.82]KAF1819529.1 Rad4-domain-containing protein [Dissoconium aciculare CBS 342.82]